MKNKILIEDIKQTVQKELDFFDKYIQANLQSEVLLLNRIIKFIVRSKGKQIRPILVFISAKAISTDLQDSTYRAASVLEILHTATLVHDDVIDESMYRRSFFSINAVWKNKIAVLVGDFLLSKSLLICIENKDYTLLDFMSKTVKKMSEGELLQLQKSKKMDITEGEYFDIISKKTAVLLACCCGCGAASVTNDKNKIDLMYNFGYFLGMAFQIKDDLFDYTTTNIIGKPVGIDIKEGKLTLPLIYSLNAASSKKQKEIYSILRKKNKKSSEVSHITKFVFDTGGVDYANKKIEYYYNKAKNSISEIEDSKYKESLLNIMDYVIYRNK